MADVSKPDAKSDPKTPPPDMRDAVAGVLDQHFPTPIAETVVTHDQFRAFVEALAKAFGL